MKQTLNICAFFTLIVFASPRISQAQTSDALYISPSGNVGISTSTPRAALDVATTVGEDTLRTVLGRLPEGNTFGRGTYLGVRAFHSQMHLYSGKSFSIEHSFYGIVNNSINFFRGPNGRGGFMTFNTDSNFERMRIDIRGYVGIGTDHPDYKLDVNGSFRATEVKDNTGYVTPKGGIIMWSGNAGDFGTDGKGRAGTAVEGWALCDGQGTRPDLRDRFVVGAGKDYTVGKTGGEAKHTLTEEEMPSHSHANGVGGGRSHETQNTGWGNSAGYACNDCAFQVWSKKTGGGAAHENRPPFYALLYIIKL